jgi:serine phosphatase RsbU (regulator of sigma subunit)
VKSIAKAPKYPGSSGTMSFWTAVHGWSRLLLLTAVFCLFAAVGLMALEMQSNRATVAQIVLRMVVPGGFAVGYAALAMARRLRYFPVLILAQVLTELLLAKIHPPGERLAGAALQSQLVRLAVVAMVGILVAYSLMFHFFRVEGKRYFEMRTEMALAKEIHDSLVPVCATSFAGFEIYGASVPSGEVGGDLVDVVERPGEWTGYVADVSGHGVQSGVFMAMFKTAMRAQIVLGNSPGRILREVHGTLFPLKPGNMFVTVAILQARSDGKARFASAGHLPVLQYHKDDGTVSQHSALNPPLGIAPEQEFSESTIQCRVGDGILVLTDGLTEVFDKKGNEIGLDPLKERFGARIDSSLPELFRELRTVATEFGPQVDDQTMLLARYQG